MPDQNEAGGPLTKEEYWSAVNRIRAQAAQTNRATLLISYRTLRAAHDAATWCERLVKHFRLELSTTPWWRLFHRLYLVRQIEGNRKNAENLRRTFGGDRYGRPQVPAGLIDGEGI